MLRVLVFAVPFVALAGLTILLEQLDAGVGATFAAFGLIAVLTGSAIGYFSDRLIGPRNRGRRPNANRS
ncbi:MAG TPA: hypothetical protein VKB23_06185 [Solirubrobacterales bacterium]|nr:hypothetical protein [Solirubrobacterales bacterium]